MKKLLLLLLLTTVACAPAPRRDVIDDSQTTSSTNDNSGRFKMVSSSEHVSGSLYIGIVKDTHKDICFYVFSYTTSVSTQPVVCP